jgi:DNA-binding transcriptional ArsR family regulator
MANELRVSAQFAALADPTRRKIFERLAVRARAVGEVAEGLEVSRPAVSQHLKVLKDAGLVTDRAEGTRRVYQVEPRGVRAMQRYLSQFWDEALERFKEVAEKETDS